jgi:hypothetical protein
MLYNQPFDKPPEITYGDTPYINGNPSTGQPGSIPSAASVEYPQREIVNLIKDAVLLTPSNSDLHQLGKAVQSGQLNFKHDTGTANAYACNLSPDPGAPFEGLCVILKILNTNTGPSVFNINSHGNYPIVRVDGSPVVSNGLLAGSYVCFLFDGANWRTVWSSSTGTVSGQPIWLTGPRDLYVDFTLGNDSYDGTSATFTSGVAGPFKTIQRAANEYPKWNLNGYAVTIHVANYTNYAGAVFPAQNGSGTVILIGNTTTTNQCVVNGVNQSAIAFSASGSFTIRGFQVSSTGTNSSGDPLAGISITGNGTFVSIGEMAFGTCLGSHISVTNGAIATNTAPHVPWAIFGPSNGSSYEPGCFIFVQRAVFAIAPGPGPDVAISNALTFAGSFINADSIGQCSLLFGSLTIFVSVSGKRYNANGLSMVNSAGGGINYYPGTIAGTVSNGGVYA